MAYHNMKNYSQLLLLLLLQACWLPTSTVAQGGERRAFTTPAFDYSETHRQDLCPRYHRYYQNRTYMEDALRGLELSTLFFSDAYFPYNDETGIPSDAPLLADLMDRLADKAGFTWRQSFGIVNTTDYEKYNKTYTDILVWGVETYDVYVGWVAQSLERMRRGVVFVEPWFDSSTVLIDKQVVDDGANNINWFAWLNPFDGEVWAFTFFTVLVSSFVFQLIENIDGERNDRPMRQWCSDNLYLSCLSLFQTFEYAPTSVSGRMFGVSMTIWSLIMTSTYTANLASMLVAENRHNARIDTMEKAIELDVPICTKRGVVIDENVLPQYPGATNVIRTPEFIDSYQALNSGKCRVVLDQMDSWFNNRVNSAFNPSPDCNVDWVGTKVDNKGGGLAVKADAGHLCTSFLRDVLDLHMKELVDSGAVDQLWAKYRNGVDDGKCFGVEETDSRRRRRLRTKQDSSNNHGRKLDAVVPNHLNPQHRQLGASKAGGGGPSEDDADSSAMSIYDLAGAFLFHWVLMAISLCMSIAGIWMNKLKCGKKANKMWVRKINRRHGPIIGAPPPVNTWVEVDLKDGAGQEEAANVEKWKENDSDDDDDNSKEPSIPLADLFDNSLSGYGPDKKRKTGMTATYEDSLTSYGHGSFQKPSFSPYKASLDSKRKTIVVNNRRRSTILLAKEQPNLAQRILKNQSSSLPEPNEELRDRVESMMSLMEEFLRRDERREREARRERKEKSAALPPGEVEI